MYKIEITQETNTATSMAALLKEIARLIESGNTFGGDMYNPTWNLLEV